MSINVKRGGVIFSLWIFCHVLSLVSASLVISIIDLLFLICFSHLFRSWPCVWMKPLIPMFFLCLSLQRSSRSLLGPCRRKTHWRQSYTCVTSPLSNSLRTAQSCPGCTLAGLGSRPAAAAAAQWSEVLEGSRRFILSLLLGGDKTPPRAGCSEAEKCLYVHWVTFYDTMVTLSF